MLVNKPPVKMRIPAISDIRKASRGLSGFTLFTSSGKKIVLDRILRDYKTVGMICSVRSGF